MAEDRDSEPAGLGESLHPLIASDRVEGTPVRRPDGTPLGRIERLMIDKVSGRVAYAAMGVGGVLGLGAEHLLVPWGALHFDQKLDAYRLDLDESRLAEAPRRPAGPAPYDRAWEEGVHRYYDTLPYWPMSG